LSGNQKHGIAQVGIIATGALTHKALLVAKELDAQGIKTKILNIHTIKPLDTDAVEKLAREAKVIVVVEEHQVTGGLGSAVAECLASVYPVPIEFVGVKDSFGQSGTPAELIEHYGMGEKDIKGSSEESFRKKREFKNIIIPDTCVRYYLI
jgi:transketolase